MGASPEPAQMTDFLSKETRSRVMAQIRSKDTGPELALRRALHAAAAAVGGATRSKYPGSQTLPSHGGG